MNRNWTRSIQSNWIKKQIITIRFLDYSNLVPINFKIKNQIYKTSELKLIHIHIHNCCWKSENKSKRFTYTILLFWPVRVANKSRLISGRLFLARHFTFDFTFS